MWYRILSALSLTNTAEIFLLPVGRSTVTHQCVAPAMRTMNDDGDHGIFNLVYSWCPNACHENGQHKKPPFSAYDVLDTLKFDWDEYLRKVTE
jgi:hypothetical protein